MGKGKARGFNQLVVTDSSAKIEQLREDIDSDIKKTIKKLKKKDKEKDNSQNDLFKNISIIESWNRLGQIQQNISARISSLAQLAQTSGPNAGKIIVPQTWNSDAQELVGRMLDAVLGIEVDVNNGFASLRAMDLWTILGAGLGGGSMGDNLFSSILLFQYLGNGLNASPAFAGLPGVPNINTLLLPRVIGGSIAILA